MATCIRKPLGWQILCDCCCCSSPHERLQLLSLSSRPFAASALSSGSSAGVKEAGSYRKHLWRYEERRGCQQKKA